jgi:hypothetical protein
VGEVKKRSTVVQLRWGSFPSWLFIAPGRLVKITCINACKPLMMLPGQAKEAGDIQTSIGALKG